MTVDRELIKAIEAKVVENVKHRQGAGRSYTLRELDQIRARIKNRIDSLTNGELKEIPSSHLPDDEPELLERWNDLQGSSVPQLIQANADDQIAQRRNVPLEESLTDSMQLAGDVAGVFDPTPLVDGANAIFSLFRAYKDPDRRGEHLTNAAISGIGMIPLIGDSAKLLKLGKVGRTLNGLKSAEHLQKLAPFLGGNRQVTDILDVLGNREGGGFDLPSIGSGSGGGDDGGGINLPGLADGGPPGPLGMMKTGFSWLLSSLGKIAAKGLMVVGAFVGVFESVTRFNKGLLAVNSYLGELNGEIAAANARREVAGISRDVETGEYLADSFSEAAEADIYADDVRARFTRPITKMVMDGSASLTNFVASTVDIADRLTRVSSLLDMFANGVERATGIFDPFIDRVKSFLGIESKKEEDKDVPGAAAFLDDIADGKLDGKSKAGDFFSRGGNIK